MASAVASQKPRRSTFGKVASIFCLGEARVDSAAFPQKPPTDGRKTRPQSKGSRAAAIDKLNKVQVELLMEASSRLVVGTPTTLLHPTQPQALEAELRNERQQSADLRNQLQRLTAELIQERARSATLEAKVADREERLLVTKMVAKAQLKAATSAVAEEIAAEAAMQKEHDLAVLKEESQRREEDLTTKVVRLTEQVNAVDKRRKDKYRNLKARDAAKTQQLHVANKKAAEMEEQLSNMGYEMECLKGALVHLPVIPEEDCPIVRTLGEGAYGQVTLRCIPVAVKEMVNPENALDLLKEQQLMSRLRHHAIPGAMAWMQKRDGTKCLAIQYVDGQSMEQFREMRTAGENINLDPCGQAGLSLLERLTEPIQHIHDLGHVHRDISCRNVMISEDYDGHFNPHLIDLGMAYDMRTPPAGWGGSPGFMRPVIALHPEAKGPADDVRGFCAVAWEFLSGCDIWQTLHDDYIAAIETNFSIEEDVQCCCNAHYLDSGDIVQCVAAAEYLGHIGIGEEYFEPLLENPFMPAKALRLIARGLSSEVARNEAPPPHMADIRTALKADRENVELMEVMRLLGCRL
ncbi:g5681 [Coccomyxa elongata]